MSYIVKNTPVPGSQEASEKKHIFDKDTISILPKQERRLLIHLLRSTRPQSVTDIVRALGQSDPRGHISSLRRRGYPIGDVWCKSNDGVRFKRYFVRKEVEDGRE